MVSKAFENSQYVNEKPTGATEHVAARRKVYFDTDNNKQYFIYPGSDILINHTEVDFTGFTLAASSISGTITSSQIAASGDSRITAENILDHTITNLQLANAGSDRILAENIFDHTITNQQIANSGAGRITADNILDGTITGGKLSNSLTLPAETTCTTQSVTGVHSNDTTLASTRFVQDLYLSKVATNTQVKLATDGGTHLTPLSIKFSPAVAKAWAKINGFNDSGPFPLTLALDSSYNVSAAKMTAAGVVQIDFATALANSNFVPLITLTGPVTGDLHYHVFVVSQSASSVTIRITGSASNNNSQDGYGISFLVFGDSVV